MGTLITLKGTNFWFCSTFSLFTPLPRQFRHFGIWGKKSRMDFVCHLGDTLTSAPFGPFVDNVQSFVVFVVVDGFPKDVPRTTTSSWSGKSDHFF